MKWLAIVVSIVVLAAVIAAFVTVGSPSKQRALNFDVRRVSDLELIQSQIVTYFQSKHTLPSKMSDLHDSLSNFDIPTDPETGASYEYTAEGTQSFQLCANFNLPSTSTNSPKTVPTPYGGDLSSSNWDHTAGHVCFDRTIDPQLYPPKAPVR